MRRARVTGTLLSAIGLLGSSAVCNRRHCRSSPCGSWSPIPVLVGLLARQLSYAARHDGPASFGTGHRCEIKCQALQVLGGGGRSGRGVAGDCFLRSVTIAVVQPVRGRAPRIVRQPADSRLQGRRPPAAPRVPTAALPARAGFMLLCLCYCMEESYLPRRLVAETGDRLVAQRELDCCFFGARIPITMGASDDGRYLRTS